MRFSPMARKAVSFILLCSSYVSAIDTTGAFESHPTYLIIDMLNTPNVLPRNFRTSRTPYKEGTKESPTRQGLDHLKISGSAQFSYNGLKTLLSHLDKAVKITIVDLRQESHGFVNGIAISWFAPKDWGNVGKTPKQIQEEENKLLQGLLKERTVSFHTVEKKNIDDTIQAVKKKTTKVEQVATESQIVRSFHINYVRFFVTDHVKPSDDEVERFLTFFHSLEPNEWVHFHCAAGKGRTTTFLAMYDMLHNAKSVSFEDILKRQYLIGGSNFMELPDVNNWKYPLAAERLNFLKQFYEFCRTRSVYDKSGWGSYINKPATVN